MKFRGLRPPTNENDVPGFVITELVGVINDLVHGLKKMTLGDNFESFEVDVEIPAGVEVSITNQLDFIPTRYIILRNSTGQPIGDGLSAAGGRDNWNEQEVKLENFGTVDTVIRVIFMR